ncbi:MAG: glycine cleavage system protein GcvH [Gemmatimonadaceae bacterium]|nr:glycine cleavage system protein GcvH [Gemmatimonadaceae bacterium]
MSTVPDELLYSEEHLWVEWTDDVVTVGLTDYAQKEMGDTVFVELPSLDEKFARLDVFGTIEAVKAVSELFSPIGGVVLATNPRLAKEPELLNTDPYGEGWLIRLRPSSLAERDELLGSAEYREHTGD